MNIFDLALAMTPRVGGRTAAHLIETFFSAENIFSQPYEVLRERAKLNDAVAKSIVNRDGFAAAHAEMKHCEKHGITPISLVDERYPSLLRESHDPPYIIYVQGDLSLLTRNLVSIVGTRNMTNYGDRVTNLIVEQLAAKVHNLVIVSGLAFGIDSAAHRAALKFDVPTIAILPNPLPGVTPAAHSQLARGIIDSGGALLTELRSTAYTAGKAYMARNRIIASISAATIVVESGVNGGAISTARIAASEGRVVAAVPGRIVDGASMGCNRLIANREAMVLNSADDLIAELAWEDRVVDQSETPRREPRGFTSDAFSEEQCVVLRHFSSSDPISLSELENLTGFTITQLGVLLMELELSGAVSALPGARYQSLLPDV